MLSWTYCFRHLSRVRRVFAMAPVTLLHRLTVHRPSVRIQPLDFPAVGQPTRGYTDPALLFPEATKRLNQVIEAILTILTCVPPSSL